MKEWQLIESPEAWNKFVTEYRKFMLYTGPEPKQYPCVACPRVSTEPKIAINLAYPLAHNAKDYLYPNDAEKYKFAYEAREKFAHSSSNIS